MSEAKLTQFMLNNESVPVRFMETQTVKEGVVCDIYAFTNDSSRDLAIVRVANGHRTPLQRVLLGDKTIEGIYRGVGTLTVQSAGGQTNQYTFSKSVDKEVIVEVGQTMQWHADGETDLIFYEICEPPYSDGRFENLDDTTR